MPTQGNPKLTVRIDEHTRARFVAAAYNAGTTGSELVTAFIRWYLGEDGAELPRRPEPAREQ
ncbi:hypothetical protein [Prauserella muralis]|uniref:Uncharacterized protein n=1 Tax=Prauserella muralis TaxID=588067 RepID=A0A2V4B099_9PSEU|nr:hypothetical protein [Prauserella muralis]PXY27423.1 hypothetical protein BAY60_13390 [Prauserella muralis]TWE22877.1 hypothetical protein FHX69_4133 [Prauserella muralis]